MNSPRQGSFLYRRIEGKIIIWLENKNQWIQFEEPAFEVFRGYMDGLSEAGLAGEIAGKYGLNGTDAVKFVRDITEQIKNLPDYTPRPATSSILFKNQEIPEIHFNSSRLYRIGERRVRMSFGTAELEYMIHTSFAHLEDAVSSKAVHHIEIFPYGSEMVLRIGEMVWTEPNKDYIKRRLFIELSGLLYNRTDADWLAIMHASSVSRHNKSVIFMSESGSGKSTFTALMHHRGFQFDSDDYVPLDSVSLKALPFPAALSVKSGAFPVVGKLYPELDDLPSYYSKHTQKTLKYLPLSNKTEILSSKTILSVIFLRYVPETKIRFEKLSVSESFVRFANDAWITDKPNLAGKFIDWFATMNFYLLEYGDNYLAVEKVASLF